MTNAHILQTLLELGDTEPDENGQIPDEVRRKMQAVASVSRDPEAVKQLFAPQTQMSFGRDSADDEVDNIINRAQQAGITVSDEVRKRVLALVKKK